MPAAADDPELPRYPPFLKGLPAAPPERLLATQTDLIARLQDGLGFTDERFTTLVRPVIARYVAFVHLMPASEAHHHRGAGGLLRHGLEVAFHAARASQGRVFALDRSPGVSSELEPRWRLAAGLAGLCHDLGKPVSDLSVSDRSGQRTWRPLLGSLSDWAAGQGVAHYYLRWPERRHRRHEPLGLLVLPRVLAAEVSAWLADPDPEILSGLRPVPLPALGVSVVGALLAVLLAVAVANAPKRV